MSKANASLMHATFSRDSRNAEGDNDYIDNNTSNIVLAESKPLDKSLDVTQPSQATAQDSMQRVTELRKSDEDSFLGGGNSRATKADREKWHQSFMSSISKRNSLVQDSIQNPILMRGSLN